MIRISIKQILASLLVVGTTEAVAQKISHTAAISEVFGDGAKITTAVLTCDAPINGKRLTTGSFKVDGRTVTRVYTSNSADKGTPLKSGRYVIIELKTEPQLDTQTEKQPAGGTQGPVAGQKSRLGNSQRKNKTPGTDSVIVRQTATLYTTGGKAIKPSGKSYVIKSSRTLIADDFKQFVFHDKATGINLRYNLYTPKNLQPGKHYPLIMFIHDASGAGMEVKNTLLQGNGATVWASPEWQAEHPCFVLAPQFDQVTVDDNFNTTPDLDACLNLIDSLIKDHPVDTRRIYTTGQSMGCMSSYVLMLRRPDLFTSAMLVAGQWNPDVMAPLAKKNLWLISCMGDTKSSEGVAKAINVWKQNGATVVEQEWPLEATPAERDKEVAGMLAAGGNIHYTHFTGGSHRNTWIVAYYIKGIREWLFKQVKP